MRVSRHKVDGAMMDLMWETIVEFIGKNYSSNEAKDILGGLLTRNERIAISKRLMVGIMTISGYEVNEIVTELKVCRNTVYKFQEYIDLNPEYQKVLNSFTSKLMAKVKAKDKDKMDIFEKMFFGRQKRYLLKP